MERLPHPISDDDRRVLEIAAAFMGDERAATARFLYSGWCLTSLPHRRIPDADAWRLDNGGVTLLVEPGRRILKSGADTFCGVPYGATARLILIFLQSEALRNNSRQVELGTSMRRWLGKLGKEVGGKTAKLVRDQALRISTCKYQLPWACQRRPRHSEPNDRGHCHSLGDRGRPPIVPLHRGGHPVRGLLPGTTRACRPAGRASVAPDLEIIAGA